MRKCAREGEEGIRVEEEDAENEGNLANVSHSDQEAMRDANSHYFLLLQGYQLPSSSCKKTISDFSSYEFVRGTVRYLFDNLGIINTLLDSVTSFRLQRSLAFRGEVK